MPIVTAITMQVKDKNRVNVFIDGDFCCGLLLETVMKYKLKVGDTITRDNLAQIQYDSEKSKALNISVSYLSRSMKTQKQIEKYLTDKGYGNTVIFFVIEKLKEYGYIDDSIYAKTYIKSYISKKGKKLIEYELISKGIANSDIEKAYLMIEESEERLPNNPALSLAEKYMKNKPCDNATIQKLYRHLLSKGFDYDEVKSAVSKYKESQDD